MLLSPRTKRGELGADAGGYISFTLLATSGGDDDDAAAVDDAVTSTGTGTGAAIDTGIGIGTGTDIGTDTDVGAGTGSGGALFMLMGTSLEAFRRSFNAIFSACKSLKIKRG